ncbi:MAG: hypothetical protein RL748_453 [Pseudomonadota bacterium]|jgi:RHS repeat-associated protein
MAPTVGTDRTRICTDKGTNAATNTLPNGPECTSQPNRSQLEQWAQDAKQTYRKGLHQIASATNWIDTRSAVGAFLGDKSFTAGIAAGMAENLIEGVLDLAKLMYTLTLADVYEVRHETGFWRSLGAHIRLASNPSGLNMLLRATFSTEFEQETRRAYEERQVLFAAITFAFENPKLAFNGLKESELKKFEQFKAFKERHTLAGEFHAGVLFGALLMDVLMIVDGVTAIYKIASRVPGLLKVLGRLKKATPTVKVAGAGGEAARGARGADAAATGKGGKGGEAGKGGEGGKGGDKGKADPKKEGKSEKDGSPCPLKGRPVDAINGCKVLFDALELDFDLPAPLALPWQRSYSSDNGRTSWLGQGWHLPISLALEFSEKQITLLDGLNRGIAFSHIPVGESIYSRHEQITLTRQDLLRFELVDSDDVRNQFHLPTPNAKRAHLIKRIDRNGNTISIDYNEQQQPTRVIDSAGRIFALAFNPQQRLTSVSQIDPEGSSESVTLVHYDYDEAGDLIRVRNRAGQTTREFAYRNHLMVKHAQPGGLVSEYEYSEYQPSGKVLRNHTNTGLSWQFAYGKNQTMVTDNLGRKTQTAFNDDKRYLGGLDALGGQAVRELDAYGNLIAYTDEAGHTTRYQYDTRSRMTRIEDPDGAVTQISYDMRFDKPVTITNAAGGITRLRYDPYANLNSIIDPLGQTTQYRVDSRGLPIEIIDARGGSKKLEYNRAGQVTSYTDCSGQTSRFEYDRFGNLTQTTDALNHSTRYQYDEAGRLHAAHYPDGSSEQYQYDQLGRLIGHTDALGQQTRYQFDAEGRLEKRTNALGHSLSYHYDAAKRLAQLVNENGAVYAFEYDALDRLRQETGFDARTTRYDYDLAGKPKTKIELGQVTGDGVDNSIRTEFQRDVMGRLIEKTVSGAQHASAMVNRYQYDTLGRLVHAANPTATVELEYDAIGQLRAEKSRMPSGSDILHSVLRHSYDELGNRTQTILPDGRTLNHLYYGSGHLHQINIDGEVISDIERDNKHREVSRSQGALTSQFQYDPVGRLSAQVAQLDPARAHASLAQQREAWQGAEGALAGATNQNTTPAIIARQYQYDLAGNLIAQNDQRFGKTVYQYDAIGRILGAAQPNLSETFAFDPAHNLLDPASINQGNSGGRVENNQLTVFEDKRFAYDAHGNLDDKKIGKHTRIELVWNAKHQLIQSRVTRDATAATPTTQTTEYGYDPFGRRIFKRDAFGETRFVWDGNRMLAETRGSHTRTYLYADSSFVPLAQIESGDKPVVDMAKPKAEVLYFHTDHLGTPRELTDDDGKLHWAATYKAWGNVLRVEMAEEQERIAPNELVQMQALRFQGQYFDVETGLHYNRYRYYDPDIGRFVSQDPIGLLGGANIYRYAPNPISWIDPFGLIAETAPGYNVYGLYAPGSNTPYYVGITDDLARRRAEHIDSGRLAGGAEMEPIRKNVTYGEARGIEQANIEFYKTKTGTIGSDLKDSTTFAERGNKVASFDHDNKTRDPSRQAYFEDAYKKEMDRKKKGC